MEIIVLEGGAILDCSDPYEPWYIEVDGKDIVGTICDWIIPGQKNDRMDTPVNLGKLRITIERLID